VTKLAYFVLRVKQLRGIILHDEEFIGKLFEDLHNKEFIGKLFKDLKILLGNTDVVLLVCHRLPGLWQT